MTASAPCTVVPAATSLPRWTVYSRRSRRVSVRMTKKDADIAGPTPLAEAELIPLRALDGNDTPGKPIQPDMVGEVRTALRLLKRQASAELLAIAMVYFVEGFLALSTLAVSYFLKDNLGQTPAQVAILEGFGAIPWIIKPLYGFASDSFPLFGYRRRSYLMFCGLLGSTAWLVLGTGHMTPLTTAALLMVSSVGIACSDVVVDSITVERARGEPLETSGSLQSLCWASMALGGILSSYYGGYFVEVYGPQFVFRSIAVLPLLVALSAFLIEEKPAQTPKSQPPTDVLPLHQSPSGLLHPLRSQIEVLWGAFRQKRIFFPAMFIFIYNATPSAGSAMFFFETNVLNFSPEFMGRVTLIGQIAHLLGVGIYRFYLRSVPLKKIFSWSCILATLFGMTQLILISRWNSRIGLSDQLFVLGDSAVLQVIGQVAMMPVLVLAARICPEGIEATLFALLMSINNGGGITGGLIGAGLTKALGVTDKDFSNLGLLMTICVFSNLLPLLCTPLVSNAGDDKNKV